MSKKALITGASGFIGSHLARHLLAQEWDVWIATRNRDRVHNHRLTDIWSRLGVIETDIRHRERLRSAVTMEPDVVFHLAAFNHVGESFRQVEEAYQVNALGSANVIDIFAMHGRVVYISTSEVYGHQQDVPWVETMQPRPQSPYAISKYAGELHALMAQKLGLPVVVLRPFNTFGPGQSEKAIVPELITGALRGADIVTTPGKQTREFNYVSDVVRGIEAAGLVKDVPEGPINLASGKDVSIRSLVEKILILTRSKSKWRPTLEYRPNEIWTMRASAQKAKTTLEWEPKMAFDTGLWDTVEWFRKDLGL